MSAGEFADAQNVPVEAIEAVLQCRAPLTAELALRLARYFDMSPEFWLNLQQEYDLRVATRDRGKAIAKEGQPRMPHSALLRFAPPSIRGLH